LAVPELIRSTGIQLNARLSLRRPCELLTLSQSRDLADAASIGGHAYRAIRGRWCVIEGSGPAHSQVNALSGAGAAQASRMDLEALLILLAIVFVAGGMVGYGIGSVVSKTRRDRMRK